MDSFDDDTWDFLNHKLIDDVTSNDLSWINDGYLAGVDIDFSRICAASQENEGRQKRGRNDSSTRPGSKACREKLRRERLNDRFLDLSSILEPGKSAKTDKLAILGDAIQVLNQLRNEAKDLEDANEKLQEEIRSLKAEKNELREEKLLLKADKERIEQQMKAISAPAAGFWPTYPAATHHTGANKSAVFPSYGMFPMWQYMPSSALDTSHDHELRPPAA
ncbi:hypothetical protein PVL29_006114 [Vitis rotundifolia]|uniref:BHLH domain-containing protein n=1 Tax=Vitis rotundifolia TaxID=103349 RepID=A0AA39A698_VITRO|nr:hypothetical protein PVL29_006114 [Vitis rotundifolia]